MTSAKNLPLEGVTVLDCTQVMAGPFCTLLLADMGANVIKIEKPAGGDDNRKQGPPFIEGRSAAFLAVNRNKRSIVLDLKSDPGRNIFLKMAKKSHVIVENFRPGTMDSLKIGFGDLIAINPSLVYCSISGFGQTGPYSGRRGFDLIAQGMSGLMSVTGTQTGPPIKIGVPITDLTAGMYGAYGILSAYIHSMRTGEGQMVDTSLLEAGIAYTFWESSVYFSTGNIPAPLGSAHRLSAPYQAIRTEDGYINIGGATQPTWENLCRTIGMESLILDPRFKSNGDRKQRESELAGVLEETFCKKPTTYWLNVLEKAGVPAGPIYDMEQVYSDPHVSARQMMVQLEDPELGVLKNIGIPVKLSRTPGSIRHRAPELGEHTYEIMSEFGFSEEEIKQASKLGTFSKVK